MNPLFQLREAGQSTWLDYIRRGLITSGELQRLVDDYAVAGLTSNPTIFDKAISGSTDYDDALRSLVQKGERDPNALFLQLAEEDIGMAADVLRPVHEKTKGGDGFVSLEVSPHLAHDTAGSIQQAGELFSKLARPNVMIKIPGTPEGVPAIEELTAQGVNVNVTLLFDVKAYEQAALAYTASYAAIAHLVRRRGEDRLASFLEDLLRIHNPDRALKRNYRLDVDGLDAALAAELR